MWLFVSMVTETAGAAAIKLGQWASSRPDLFSLELCETLSKLQKSVEPHKFSYTERTLADRLGPEWRNVIQDLDSVPLGSGCVAQVGRS